MTTLSETPPTQANRVTTFSAVEAQAAIECGDAVLVDVREPFERAAAFIPSSHAAPLSSFDAAAIAAAYPNKRIVFQCKSGSRSGDAANRFAHATEALEIGSLAGGIDAWRAAGLPVERSVHAPKIDIMRQVQMIAGGLVVIGLLLGAFVHPVFLILAGFVGGGLFFAGASGWCGMALLLGAMPWNRIPGETPKATCRTKS